MRALIVTIIFFCATIVAAIFAAWWLYARFGGPDAKATYDKHANIRRHIWFWQSAAAIFSAGNFIHILEFWLGPTQKYADGKTSTYEDYEAQLARETKDREIRLDAWRKTRDKGDVG